MGIKLGNIDVSYFKVGSADCKVYLGDTLLYPQSQPQTLQWVTFSNGDTIPSDLHIYGIKGIVNDLSMAFSDYTDDIYVEDAGRNKYNVFIGDYYSPCHSEDGIVSNTSVEYIFSNIGCSDYYTVNNKTIANMSNDIQLYIYGSPTPTYQWVSYQNGDTVPTTTTVYGVKIYLNYDEDYNIIFSGATGDYIRFYPNGNFGQWSAEDENGNPINISSYFDGYDGVYTILFSDLGMGGMNTISPSTTFEDDIELYEIQ